MLEVLAAVPVEAWMAGLLAATFGGLCAAFGAVDRAESLPAPTVPAPRLHLEDVPWNSSALDDDPIWATGRAVVS